jgi:SAM-dependent methyltransferase
MFFSVNIPFRDHEVADYERRRYRGWDQRLVHHREMKILKKFLGIIAASRPGNTSAYALDSPCGYGRFARLLIDHNFRLASSDLSLAMVQRARLKDTSPRIPVGIVSNLTQGLPFKTNAFTLVFSMRFFHHLHHSADRRSALAEFARASGGWVILSYYQANPLHRLERALRRKIKREEAESAGLEIVNVRPLFRGIHAQHIALLRKIGILESDF